MTFKVESLESMLVQARDLFIQSPKVYDLVNQTLRKTEDEIQDVLHVIEFGKNDAVKRSELYSEVLRLRVERRKLKNELELLEEVRQLASKKTVNEHLLNTAIGRVRKVMENQEKRSYRMRVRDDLQSWI